MSPSHIHAGTLIALIFFFAGFYACNHSCYELMHAMVPSCLACTILLQISLPLASGVLCPSSMMIPEPLRKECVIQVSHVELIRQIFTNLAVASVLKEASLTGLKDCSNLML